MLKDEDDKNQIEREQVDALLGVSNWRQLASIIKRSIFA